MYTKRTIIVLCFLFGLFQLSQSTSSDLLKEFSKIYSAKNLTLPTQIPAEVSNFTAVSAVIVDTITKDTLNSFQLKYSIHPFLIRILNNAFNSTNSSIQILTKPLIIKEKRKSEHLIYTKKPGYYTLPTDDSQFIVLYEKIENKLEDDNAKKKKQEKKDTENEMIKIPDWDLEPPFDTIDRGEL